MVFMAGVFLNSVDKSNEDVEGKLVASAEVTDPLLPIKSETED